MKFITYASGSTGNLYSLADGKTSLLIEAGLPYKEMQRLTGHTLSSFDACLVTHEHMDHAKGASAIMQNGTPVYCSRGTAGFLGFPTYYELFEGRGFDIGTFQVIPFPVDHDAAEPLGFLIRSYQDGESMVFATDTFFLRNIFPPVTIWAIECNYAHDLIPADCPRADRLFSSHMSISQCLATFKANDLSKCREIHILHLSSAHSDENRFVKEVQEATGVPTYAAPAYSKKGVAL